jgi:hypothetical protein
MGRRKSASRPHPPKFIEKDVKNADQHYAKISKFHGGATKNTEVFWYEGSRMYKRIFPLAGKLRPGKAKVSVSPGDYCLCEGNRIIYIYKKNELKRLGDLDISSFTPSIDHGYDFDDDIDMDMDFLQTHEEVDDVDVDVDDI